MKVATIIRARPQLIMASVVSNSFRATPSCATEIAVHTGQHYRASISAVFFSELGRAEPEKHLSIGSGTHAQQKGRMLQAGAKDLLAERPNCVLVNGDTNSTLAVDSARVRMIGPVG